MNFNTTRSQVVAPGVVQMNIQVNISSYYTLEVRYYGVTLKNTHSKQDSQWFYVDVDTFTGVTRDQQWTLSLAGV